VPILQMTSTDVSKLKKEFLVWLQDLNVDCVSKCETLPSEFFPLLQSPKLKQLWVYLIHHVKNDKLAQKVKKNIALQSLRSENKVLRQSCYELSDELAKLNIEVQRLEEKVKQKQLKCAKLGMTMPKTQRCIDNNYMKSLFHQQCSHDLTEKQVNMNLQNQVLKQSVSPHLSHNTTSNDQQFYACRDKLKKLLSSIHNHFNHGSENNGDHIYINDSWKSALGLLKLYPPKMILDALSYITQQTVDEVQSNLYSESRLIC